MIVWVVPSGGGTSPDKLFCFDMVTGQWTIEAKPVWFIDAWTLSTTTTWQNLIDLGYTTWEDFGSLMWGDFVTETPRLVMSGTNGQVYFRGGESDDGSDFDGYRIEPVLDFGFALALLFLSLPFFNCF